MQRIENFVHGRKSGRRPNAHSHLVVTFVPPDEVDAFIGARTPRERVRHLRKLRRLGLLLHEPRKLGQRIVVGRDGRGYPRHRWGYCFRGEAGDVPRIERRDREPAARKRRGRVGEISYV